MLGQLGEFVFIVLGTSSGEQLSYEASEMSHETSSDVTLQSHDTWGGLAPPPQPQPLISDEVSGSCLDVCYDKIIIPLH